MDFMKNLNVKEHTDRYMKLAKTAGSGIFPNKRAAKIGSIIGLGIGGVLLCVGIYGFMQSAVFGVGSLVAGAVAIVSNAVNLKRIQSK